jgi:hypothetical protein
MPVDQPNPLTEVAGPTEPIDLTCVAMHPWKFSIAITIAVHITIQIPPNRNQVPVCSEIVSHRMTANSAGQTRQPAQI